MDPLAQPLFRRLLAGLFVLLAAAPALAERADRDKPMNIEADALRYDDAKQTSVFTGKVVLTKGTMVMRGASCAAPRCAAWPAPRCRTR